MPQIHQISSHHRGLDLAQQLGVTAHHTHIVLDVAGNFLGAKSIVAQFGSFMTCVFFGKTMTIPKQNAIGVSAPRDQEFNKKTPCCWGYHLSLFWWCYGDVFAVCDVRWCTPNDGYLDPRQRALRLAIPAFLRGCCRGGSSGGGIWAAASHLGLLWSSWREFRNGACWSALWEARWHRDKVSWWSRVLE